MMQKYFIISEASEIGCVNLVHLRSAGGNKLQLLLADRKVKCCYL